MKTVEETKKTKEDQVELKNEVKENTANTPEGAIPDDAVEAVAGGVGGVGSMTKQADIPQFHKGVKSSPTINNNRR